MDGIVFDIKRFAVHDGPGIRTTVFLKGCPLRCLWCHNPESQRLEPELSFDPGECIGCRECLRVCPNQAHVFREGRHILERGRCDACGACAEACCTEAAAQIGRRRTVREVLDEALRDRPFYESSGGGLTISGGEPLVQPGFALALARAAREAGLTVCLDTCGYAPYARLAALLPWVDLVLYDVKASGERNHKRLTGVSNRRILANLKRLGRDGARIWLRLPLVPGINDDAEHLQACAALAREIPGIEWVEIMAYHRLGEDKRRRLGMQTPPSLDGTPPAGPEQVEQWRQALLRAGAPAVRPA